jgi:hydrogenase 3 maturation protease
MKKNKKIDQLLSDWFFGSKKVVIAGIGNPFRRDDFIGVEIVRNLHNKVSESVLLIEAETIPESYLQQIEDFKPSHILLVDAGLVNESPGKSKLINPIELIRKTSISTHTLPLRIFCEYLKQSTIAKIGLLIIQPLDTNFGEGLTSKLNNTAVRISNLISKLLP